MKLCLQAVSECMALDVREKLVAELVGAKGLNLVEGAELSEM